MKCYFDTTAVIFIYPVSSKLRLHIQIGFAENMIPVWVMFTGTTHDCGEEVGGRVQVSDIGAGFAS